MMAITKIDGKGRVVIPRNIRESVGMGEGSYVMVKADGERVLIESLAPVADKYFGAFTIGRWPEDLDEFVVETIKRWWASRGT
ncbi:MAG: AbrB/MazE/SpoVT family DNA-binding domain-containing protein [Candidatus Bathyarchaeia archaeon]